MRVGSLWLAGCLIAFGCNSLAALDQAPEFAEGAQARQKGQAAQGQSLRAIGYFEKSLAADERAVRNSLSEAATLLEAGEEDKACELLAHYLANHPDHWSIRGHYAELLAKQRRFSEARE